MNRTVTLAVGLLGLAAMTAITAVSSGPLYAKGKDAKAFVDDAIRGDIAGVAIGQLAEANGGSIGVKNFGQTLDTDHSLAAAEATKVASSLGITPPGEPKSAAQREYAKLSKLSGSAFDREFIRMMIADDTRAIRAFEAEAAANQGDVSAMASRQLPTLRRHLQIVQTLKKEAQMSSAK